MSAARPGKVILIGGGGHAKVIIGALQAAGHRDMAVYDDAPGRVGTTVLGVPVLGTVAEAANADHTGALLCIGNNEVRRRLATMPLRWMTLVHPHGWVHESVTLGPGAVVFAGAVVQPESRIGAHAVVNTAASVDHECVLGDYAQVTPGVHLGGNVVIGEGAFLGVGAMAKPGVTVGAWTVVGAGAVVVTDLPPGVLAVGVPARIRRQLSAPAR